MKGMKREEQIAGLLAALEQVILGKPLQLKIALVTLLARGHLLIEDLPGMGKTTLAHALAQVLGLACRRMQFTADLLPADLLGLQIFDPQQQTFRFHPGPIFTQVLLADEINRASPKVQSALLEAMAEGKVSIEGNTHPLPDPFFVIATQNPADQAGTYPLPEPHLDRFAVRLSLGFPPREAERQLLRGQHSLLSLFGKFVQIHSLLPIKQPSRWSPLHCVPCSAKQRVSFSIVPVSKPLLRPPSTGAAHPRDEGGGHRHQAKAKCGRRHCLTRWSSPLLTTRFASLVRRGGKAP